MKLLLFIALAITALFTQAQHTAGLVKHEVGSAINMSCLIMIPLIGLLIAGVTYFLVNNKRLDSGDNSNSDKKS